jgi:hypothetical protein
MITTVFVNADGSKRILKSRGRDVKKFLRDLVHDFGAKYANVKK